MTDGHEAPRHKKKLVVERAGVQGCGGEIFVRFVLVLGHNIPATRVEVFNPTFSVGEFPSALFGNSFGDELAKIDPQIFDAKMNFSYFTATDERPSTET